MDGVAFTTESLRQTFKRFNKFMLILWRLGLGPWLSMWPEGFGRYMVITHTGRKSGKKYRTPVNYAIVDGDVYCAAGFGARSDWYQNMLANPAVEVWLQDGWWRGEAEDATNSDDLSRARWCAHGFNQDAGKFATGYQDVIRPLDTKIQPRRKTGEGSDYRKGHGQ